MPEALLSRLIQSLQKPAVFDHPVERFQLLETHISIILLTGPYAYKFKKPVDLGFLDFSTLDRRKFYCDEELRLNRRLAPELYRAVVAITGSPDHPALDGNGPPIEYAVKMVEFPQSEQLDRVMERGDLTARHIDQLADRIAAFHAQVAVAESEQRYGDLAHIREPVIQNFEQVSPCAIEARRKKRCAGLRRWSEATLDTLAPVFQERRARGAVRECHGDMHLANMALHENRVVIFDCIEFNPNLRWIDVMSETAFLMMDLDHRGRRDYARRFLNRYLERGGDYAGLRVLRHYLVYRAMVRAKVACIRLAQEPPDSPDRAAQERAVTDHLRLAEAYTRVGPTPLIITRGLSGCGKTTITTGLLERLGAVRVRSDIERKRAFGLPAEANSASGVGRGLYTAEATQDTYTGLARAARVILAAGFPAIVDATFLNRAHRQAFSKLAREVGVPFVILDLRAPETILRARVAARARLGVDASDAGLEVLEYQMAHSDPLSPAEKSHTVVVDTAAEPDLDALARDILARIPSPQAG